MGVCEVMNEFSVVERGMHTANDRKGYPRRFTWASSAVWYGRTAAVSLDASVMRR